MNIKVYYHAPIEKIKINRVGEWIDLRTAETVNLKQWETKLISLGVTIILPDGYEALLTLRSSTPKKWGVIQLNTPGIIDNAYRGFNDIWRLQVMAIRDTQIPFNTRIAQFRIIEQQPKLYIQELASVDFPDRGGFGSTGSY